MRKYFGYALSAALFLGVNAHAQAEPMTVKEAGELLTEATVSINRGSGAYCTAFKIGPAQYLTAAHCVSSMTSRHKLAKGYDYLWVKSVLVTISRKADGNRSEDWAILNTTKDNEDRPALPLGCTEELYLGQDVAYAGYPHPITEAFGVGRVISINKLNNNGFNNADFVVDFQAAPGASGSPVLSLNTGKVVGVLTEGVFSNFGPYAVGIESIRSLDVCEDVLEALEGGAPKVEPKPLPPYQDAYLPSPF